jgi:hypothetical protein
MMTCEIFRSRFTAGTDDVEVLEHLRSCENCFAFAAQSDADMLFRGIGGGEMIPPGGVDAFVGDVMREVHLRSTEKIASHRKFGWARRLAVAATLAAAVAGTLYYPRQQSVVPVPGAAIVQPAISAMTRPVIEKYDSDTATIVEMPTEGAEDVKVVMIFDERLPADL